MDGCYIRFWVGALGRLGDVLGRLGGRLGTPWGVLGASSLVRDAILGGLLLAFESMLARCLDLLWPFSRFEGFLSVSAESFPRCASTASRE